MASRRRGLCPVQQRLARVCASENGGGNDGQNDGQNDELNDGRNDGTNDRPNDDDMVVVDNSSSSSSSSSSSPLTPAEIRNLRDTVFGLDTFFVQSVDNYGESGVLFKGNIRSGAQPSAVQQKLQSKLREQMPDYSLFLMVDRDDKPTVVVIRDSAAEVGTADAAELLLAVVLGLATFVTTLNVFDAEIFNAALLVANVDPEKIAGAVPGTLAFLSVMVAHEVGHLLGAKRHGVTLSPPILLPAGLGLLGAFGAITRIKSKVQNRQVLSDVIAPGPVAGLGVGLVLTIVGLLLTKANAGGSIELDTASFAESFLVGGLSSAILGGEVFTAESVACHPVFIAGWSAMIVNAINLIPAGELDGGKLSLATFGRPGAQFVSVMSFIALGEFRSSLASRAFAHSRRRSFSPPPGVGSFANGLALFWLLLVLTIQRGPGIPCLEEVSKLEGKDVVRNVLLLLVPLVVLLPFPGATPAPLDTLDLSQCVLTSTMLVERESLDRESLTRTLTHSRLARSPGGCNPDRPNSEPSSSPLRSSHQFQVH